MLLFLFACLILAQRFFIKFYPEWMRKRLLKVVSYKNLYFMKLKNRGHIILPNHNAAQDRAAVNYSSEELKRGY
jgi:hypothetical protein